MVARNKMRRAMQQGEKDNALARNLPRTLERKRARTEAQELRRQANVVRRHMGVPTPWEWAKMARANRRRYVLAA